MKQGWLSRILLSPFSLIFSSVISLRNLFYEAGLLKATSFSIPVINVGNLSIGGTGKTPHIEYLIRLLSPYIRVATLSRGYKRKSKGFRLISPHDTVFDSGDEPLQYKRKFPRIPVAVSESRNIGIPLVVKHNPDVQLILLDDAFQHRSVVPGLNILLTEHDNLFVDDWLLPSGRLREPRSSYVRADIIIVTKCPDALDPSEREAITARIKPYPFQKLLFSKYNYRNPYFLLDNSITLQLERDTPVHLVAGIANVDYLLTYLDENCSVSGVTKYEDHHYFSQPEIEHLTKIHQQASADMIFLTTEKDATRLLVHRPYITEKKLPVFVLPVDVAFHDEDGKAFDDAVKQFLLNFKV